MLLHTKTKYIFPSAFFANIVTIYSGENGYLSLHTHTHTHTHTRYSYLTHFVTQARILVWVAVPFSRGSSQSRDRTQISHTAGGFFTSWATGRPKNTAVGSLSLLQQIFWPRNWTWVSCIAGGFFELLQAPTLWPHNAKNWLAGKHPDAGKDWRQEEKGMTEDEMVGWHH